MKLTHIALAAGVMFAASMASAATIINGNNLENALNAVTQDGSFDLDVRADQYNPSEVWTLDAVTAGNAVMMFEIAGFANDNVMGVYDLNTGTQLELFNGPAATGSRALLTLFGNTFTSTTFDKFGAYIGQTQASFSSSNFGFYLTSPEQNTLYSQAHLNGDTDGDGKNDVHMLAYQGTSTDYVKANGTNYGLFTSNNFILAWEDLVLANSDRDYADMVVMVESFIPVIEPGSIALLGLGLAGLAASRRRQKNLVA